jgi:hypothetical protein
MNAVTTTLTAASRQWASRPDDQRFTSLDEMLAFTRYQHEHSRGGAVSSRNIQARPIEDDKGRYTGLAIVGPDEAPALPTHWAFGQLAARAEAPAGYLRNLPSDLAADCINHGLHHRRAEDVGTLLRLNGGPAELAAATGPNYGRVWNADVIEALIDRFGDGVTGDFTVPGEFGKAVAVSKANTTLFASDRDMFVFLADEVNRIEVPNRRNGQPGSLARGFFVWNSEVGSATLGIATFLFDYVCCNRIVWGAQGVQEIRIRHTASAPDRFMEEVAPALLAYKDSSAQGINDAIANAMAKKIAGNDDEVLEFLHRKARFTRTQAKAISMAHLVEENRPIETLWDAATGITAYAKGVKHQDARVDLERQAGRVLELA